MPALFILFPFAGIILLNIAYSRKNSNRASLYTAAAILLLQILMSLTMGLNLWRKIDSILNTKLIINLSLNSYSSLMLFIIGLIALTSLCVGAYQQDLNMFNFSNLCLLVVIGMDGVVLVGDLFYLYVFLEITAVSTFILIAMRKNGNALEGSFKYLVLSAVASVFILLGIALIFMFTGSLKFDDLERFFSGIHGTIPMPILSAAILILSGLFIKSGLVPFHGWVPDAYSSASSAVSILAAGIETKIAGVYSLLIVFTKVFNRNPLIGHIIMIFGAVSIVVGALSAIGQDNFKTMLSFSSISQIGYIALGIGIGTPLAILGAVFHFLNHAVFKSLLFVNSAAVERKTGTVKFEKLGGLESKMPVTGITSVIGFLSTAGIPPFSGFWSKFIIITAAWEAGFHTYAVIAILSSILTIWYFLKLQRGVFFGELKEGLEHVSEAEAGFKIFSILLSIITIALGILFPFIAGLL